MRELREGPRPSYKGWKPARKSVARSNFPRPRPSYKGWKLRLVGDNSEHRVSPATFL